jgi:hypothetical protein
MRWWLTLRRRRRIEFHHHRILVGKEPDRVLAPDGVVVNAVTPPGGLVAPKTRVFVDMLLEHFAKTASASSGA